MAKEMSHSPNKKYFKSLAKSKKQPKTRITDEYVIKLDRQKKMFATLWQDMTIVTSHVQKLDLIDKKSHRVILKSLLLRIHYYHNKQLQVKESQYLIPTYN